MGKKLEELQVVIIDCQTTGMSPPKAHLLEIGWTVFSCLDSSTHIESFFVSLPEDEEIPKRITRLTGITDEMHAECITPKEIAQKLHTVSRNKLFVAHYAQFEKRWIGLLFDKYLPQEEKPAFICTREIAKRLHPDIPSKGIRAVAGYYGHTISEKLRVETHVKATEHIWRKAIVELADAGITLLSELEEYLTLPVSAEGSYEFPMDREKRLSLPGVPGIYKLLAADGTVLYIGKAKSLRSRVNSYFTKRSGNRKKLELAAQVYDVSCIEYATQLEAAIAEYDAIQKYVPQYNTSLRYPGEIGYFTRDFTEYSSEYTEKFEIGPIRLGTSIEKLAILLDALTSGKIPLAESIGLDYLPLEEGAMQDGFRMFTEKYFKFEVPSLARLVKAGKTIHRETTYTRRKSSEKGDELREPKSAITAETVHKHIERLVGDVSRLIRLSRWIIQLSQSHIIWSSSGKKRVLEVENGEVKACFSTSTKSKHLPEVEMVCRRVAIKKLNPVNCGRMRVLTSELRRLSRTGHEMTVILHISGICITGSRLRNILESV